MTWRIEFEGHTWKDEDITAGEAIDVALLAGGGYQALDPYAHPAALVAIVAVLLASRTGEPMEAALARVRALPLDRLLSSLVSIQSAPAV